MKKLTAILLALALCLCFTFASAADYTAGSYFSIEYGDDYELDDTSYTDENSDDYTWLFMLYNDDVTIDVAMEPIEDYAGFSLYSASDDEKQAYVDETVDAFSDSSCTYVDVVTGNGGVPFYVYTMEDSDGSYFYAETIANGTSINFYAYYADAEKDPDDALFSSLQNVLTSFSPVTDGAAADDTTTDSASDELTVTDAA